MKYNTPEYAVNALSWSLMIITVIYAIAIVTISNRLHSLQAIQEKNQQQQLQIIDGVCSWSIDGNTDSEKALCEHIQNKTNTRYICENDYKCWVEER